MSYVAQATISYNDTNAGLASGHFFRSLSLYDSACLRNSSLQVVTGNANCTMTAVDMLEALFREVSLEELNITVTVSVVLLDNLLCLYSAKWLRLGSPMRRSVRLQAFRSTFRQFEAICTFNTVRRLQVFVDEAYGSVHHNCVHRSSDAQREGSRRIGR